MRAVIQKLVPGLECGAFRDQGGLLEKLKRLIFFSEMKYTPTFVGGVLYWPVQIPSWSQGWMWVWRSDDYASCFMPPHYNEVLREYFQNSVEEHDAEILEQNHFVACENLGAESFRRLRENTLAGFLAMAKHTEDQPSV